ncbi:hypothetical protein QW131_18355 [Roseibium salinum]|nr:hypothetical protein [Roseibium salinum]
MIGDQNKRRFADLRPDLCQGGSLKQLAIADVEDDQVELVGIDALERFREIGQRQPCGLVLRQRRNRPFRELEHIRIIRTDQNTMSLRYASI